VKVGSRSILKSRNQ